MQELAEQVRSGDLTARQEAAVRSQLAWLLNVRATYPFPNEWTIGLPESTGGGIELSDVALLEIGSTAPAGNECLNCGGTGLQSMRTSSIEAIRAYLRALVHVAELLEGETQGIGAGVSDALAIVNREMQRVAEALDGLHA